MTTANLFDLDAELGSEEDEEFEGDEEEPRPRKQKANIDDSSEEEEDDDEEAEREVRIYKHDSSKPLSNNPPRSAKVSSSTKMKKTMRSAVSAVAKERSVEERSARPKMLCLTRKIWT